MFGSTFIGFLVSIHQSNAGSSGKNYTANFYLFNVNNKNTIKRLEICSELKINTPDERISYLFIAFLLFLLFVINTLMNLLIRNSHKLFLWNCFICVFQGHSMSIIEDGAFAENRLRLYFRKTLHLRYLTRF